MLYVGFLRLGGTAIGYYGTMQAFARRSGDEMLWRSDNIHLKAARQINFFPKQYQELIETAKAETGLQNVFAMSAADDDGAD